MKYMCMYVRLQVEKRQTDMTEIWNGYALKPREDFRNVKTLKICTGFESR